MKQPEHTMRVCSSPSCHTDRGEDFIPVIRRELGIEEGDISRDGRFELKVVDCIGMCDHRPSLMIDDAHYGDLTAKRLRELMAEIKQKGEK